MFSRCPLWNSTGGGCPQEADLTVSGKSYAFSETLIKPCRNEGFHKAFGGSGPYRFHENITLSRKRTLPFPWNSYRFSETLIKPCKMKNSTRIKGTSHRAHEGGVWRMGGGMVPGSVGIPWIIYGQTDQKGRDMNTP